MITEWSSFLRIIQYWNLGGVPEKPQNGEFQELPYRSIFQMADRVEENVARPAPHSPVRVKGEGTVLVLEFSVYQYRSTTRIAAIMHMVDTVVVGAAGGGDRLHLCSGGGGSAGGWGVSGGGVWWCSRAVARGSGRQSAAVPEHTAERCKAVLLGKQVHEGGGVVHVE